MASQPINNVVLWGKDIATELCDYFSLPGISTNADNAIVPDVDGDLYAPTTTASLGVERIGNDFRMDIDSLPVATPAEVCAALSAGTGLEVFDINGEDKQHRFDQYIRIDNPVEVWHERLDVVGGQSGSFLHELPTVQSIDLSAALAATNLADWLPCAKRVKIFVRTSSSQDYANDEATIAGADGFNVRARALFIADGAFFDARCESDFAVVADFVTDQRANDSGEAEVTLNGANLQFQANISAAIGANTGAIQTLTAANSGTSALINIQVLGLWV